MKKLATDLKPGDRFMTRGCLVEEAEVVKLFASKTPGLVGVLIKVSKHWGREIQIGYYPKETDTLEVL